MRWLPIDLGDRRQGDARIEAAAPRLVLGLSDGHPLEGISALQLLRQLGLGSYKTAWPLCAKLRRAMVAPDRNLVGTTPAGCASQRSPTSPQSAARLRQGQCRRRGNRKTDGWSGYVGVLDVGHDPYRGAMAAMCRTPWVHRIFANLKHWALGVYHGLRRKHLPSYLDEFVFRFNRCQG